MQAVCGKEKLTVTYVDKWSNMSRPVGANGEVI
jgi:hypothetical protein